MKNVITAIVLSIVLSICAFAAVDEAYVFTVEELAAWNYSGGTATVKDGYLSIVPNEGTANILAYSPTELGLEAIYAQKLHIVADFVSADGSNIGNGMPVYTIVDEDTGASSTHSVSVYTMSSNGKYDYVFDFSAKSYWSDATTLNQIRWDPTYKGTSISEIKVYEFYFEPGKAVSDGDEENGGETGGDDIIDTTEECIITFDANNGTDDVYGMPYNRNVTAYVSNVYPLPSTNPTRNGYDFAGWSTNIDGGSIVSASDKVTGDTTSNSYIAVVRLNLYGGCACRL